MNRVFLIVSILIPVLFAGCVEDQMATASQKAALAQSIAAEQPGNYYIGRRLYRRNFFFWGYIRRPQEPWSSAQLVMLNEQKVLAPDRQANAIGSDNNTEYRLKGYFSGETVYEPASNRFYPEFVLTGYQVISNNPPPIFSNPNALDPNSLSIDRPE
jgi:hypothetical protein